jgi:imidazolonepropionase-like amidohydrolase
MTTVNNAKLLGFENQIGRLEPGLFADMVLIDYKKMTFPFVDPAHDPIDALMYRGAGKFVDTVLVNGKVVVKKGKVLTIDENAVGERLAKAASQPRTDQELALCKGMDTLKEYVKKYYEGWTRKVDPKPFMMTNSRVDGL